MTSNRAMMICRGCSDVGEVNEERGTIARDKRRKKLEEKDKRKMERNTVGCQEELQLIGST